MNIEKEYLPDHQVKLTVEVEAQLLTEAKQRAAREIARKTKIPGFRPGKAPYQIVERFIGEGAIVEKAIENLVEDLYPKALDQAEVKPYAPGSLENVVSMDPPKFEFVVPLEPEVTLGDYRAIRIPYEAPVINDENVAKVLEDLRQRQAIVEPVERPVQAGDQVNVHIGAERLNAQEGQESTLIPARNQTINVQTPEDQEWPFPGFSVNLIGLSAGEEKTIEYTYPDDSAYANLRGTQAAFHAAIEDVKARTLPELNDDFAQSVGDYATLDALKAEVRSHLEHEAQEESDSHYIDQVVDKMLEDAQVKYPPQMLERELDGFVENTQNRLARSGIDFDTFLKIRKQDMDAFRTENRPVAEKRLKRALLISQVAKQEKIQLDSNELQAEMNRTLSELATNLPEKEMRKLTQEGMMYNLVNDIGADMMFKNTVRRLVSIAKGEEIPEPEEAAQPEESILTEGAAPVESDASSEAAQTNTES